MDRIEEQKVRLANKMEVFRAAQQQLNNVGNLSADELRGLLASLQANNPLANVSSAGNGNDRVKRRLRQVDKFCRNLS
jgi:hypothetical protein